MDTINSPLRGSQASGAGHSYQMERGGTPTIQGVDEQVPIGLQQDRSIPADFVGKEAARHQPPDLWQSMKKEMVELHQQVAKETLPAERAIPFSEHIMIEEFPAHFRAPSHLPAYDGTTDSAGHIRKFDNAALLHMYTDSNKCCVILTTLTSSAQQWFDQLPVGSVKSFAEFSSLFQHQFASSKKYRKSTISLFGIKHERKKLEDLCPTLQHSYLGVPTRHQKVLVNAFPQGLRGGPLFESLAKKPAVDFLDVLARAEKYMNLEDT
ncbi:UNVERIFIED_CONTAM: hypothetical protein Slati_2174700 [Sesamum latifolium]|uniref:Retrotransposon gag domain-containing protein n=1 Tax=Sesamum latifolium TaxID=2727402 RepID=A0AAW2WS84_9LAMI